MKFKYSESSAWYNKQSTLVIEYLAFSIQSSSPFAGMKIMMIEKFRS